MFSQIFCIYYLQITEFVKLSDEFHKGSWLTKDYIHIFKDFWLSRLTKKIFNKKML